MYEFCRAFVTHTWKWKSMQDNTKSNVRKKSKEKIASFNSTTMIPFPVKKILSGSIACETTVWPVFADLPKIGKVASQILQIEENIGKQKWTDSA